MASFGIRPSPGGGSRLFWGSHRTSGRPAPEALSACPRASTKLSPLRTRSSGPSPLCLPGPRPAAGPTPTSLLPAVHVPRNPLHLSIVPVAGSVRAAAVRSRNSEGSPPISGVRRNDSPVRPESLAVRRDCLQNRVHVETRWRSEESLGPTNRPTADQEIRPWRALRRATDPK